MRLVIALVFLFCWRSAAAADLTFAVIHPGQPGSPQEAQPVMDALADYLGSRVQAGKFHGRYENRLPAALELVQTARPRWGIVSLPFYVRYGRDLRLEPLASTRPGGRDKDVWRVMVPRGGVGDWRELRGSALGTMFHVPDAAACLLFQVAPGELRIQLEGTSQPLQAIRKMAKESSHRPDSPAIVVDSSQFEALQALPAAEGLQVIHESRALPTSPVVSFGPADEAVKKLAGVLMAMTRDEKGRELLRVLQTEGFGAPDESLARFRLRMEGQDARCSP
jgi:hypothetical protein